MKKLAKWIASMIDLRDAFTFGGLALVVVGLAQISAPAAWMVPGAFLMFLGMRA